MEEEEAKQRAQEQRRQLNKIEDEEECNEIDWQINARIRKW
jgi:hypothetical protein